MKRAWSRGARRCAICGGALATLALCGFAAGARVNTSRSIPLGLYWLGSAPVQRNAYVLFCPPPTAAFMEARRRHYILAGFCPGGFGYMMKQVAGVPGDRVDISAGGVRINGRMLPLSAPLKVDGAGRPLSRFAAERLVLPAAEYLLMTDVSAQSFDGRYFGPVAGGQITGVIVPVLTW